MIKSKTLTPLLLAGIFCLGEVVYPSIHGHAKLPGWKVEIPK